jgi:hypothetical protein
MLALPLKLPEFLVPGFVTCGHVPLLSVRAGENTLRGFSSTGRVVVLSIKE